MSNAKKVSKDSIFATRFREIIGDATQETIANRIGVKRQSVSYWLSGKPPNPTTLQKIAIAYNVSVNWLIGNTDIKSADPNVDTVKAFTGLSEDAINKLHDATNRNDSNTFMLSKLIVSNEFDAILKLFVLASASREFMQTNDDAKEYFNNNRDVYPVIYFELATRQGLAPYYKQQISEQICKMFDRLIDEQIELDKMDGE